MILYTLATITAMLAVGRGSPLLALFCIALAFLVHVLEYKEHQETKLIAGNLLRDLRSMCYKLQKDLEELLAAARPKA